MKYDPTVCPVAYLDLRALRIYGPEVPVVEAGTEFDFRVDTDSESPFLDFGAVRIRLSLAQMDVVREFFNLIHDDPGP